jgi:dTDP-6-deoxy-L-talose 4-dehydrogenase (NAD+)
MGRAVRDGGAGAGDRCVKVAVTGATGFIGRHVVAELARRSFEPVLVVRPSSEAPAELGSHAVVRFDLATPPAQAFDLMGRPDVLIHLAWGGLPNYRSLHHFETELPLHYRFLRSLIDEGLKSMLVTGTCFEYGMQSGALRADMETHPANPYGFAKDTLRRQLQFLQQTHPFDLAWARLFYLYGDGQAPGSLYSLLRQAVERGDAEFNMSGGEQLRDYLPIDEAARQLVLLATTGGNVGPVNVCSGTPISVRRLVETWIADNGWSIRPKLGHYPYPDYEPMAFWGSGALHRRKADSP